MPDGWSVAPCVQTQFLQAGHSSTEASVTPPSAIFFSAEHASLQHTKWTVFKQGVAIQHFLSSSLALSFLLEHTGTEFFNYAVKKPQVSTKHL